MAFAQGNTYTTARLCFLLIKWISCRFRPFAIVEDPEIIEIFQMLHARVQIPSAKTISRDVKEVYVMSQINVKKLLKVRYVFLILH